MVTSQTMRTRIALRRIAQALHDFAREQGWTPGEYQILFRILEDWGRITVLVIVKDYAGLTELEMWSRIHEQLEKSLASGDDIGFSIGFSVRSLEQVGQGGMYSIPDGYLEEEIILGSYAGH
jgi:hypothetical protein